MAQQSASELVLIYTTFPDATVAREICNDLVVQRLAACANLFPGMMAIYEWQGRLETEAECAAFLKTRASLADPLSAALKAAHPYDTPAIIVLPSDSCDKDYLSWVAQQTRS